MRTRIPTAILWWCVLAGAASLAAACRKEPVQPLPDGALDGALADAGWDGAARDAAEPDAAGRDAAGPDATLGDSSLPDAQSGPDASAYDDGGSSDAGSADGGGVTGCPPEMALVNAAFCIDRWEASRPDATGISAGVDESYATSRPGVLPWWSSLLTQAVARQACQNAGKRLCAVSEWQAACAGPSQTTYCYGNTYEATTCNGIDTRCDCTQPTCASQPECPYAHCWSACGGTFHADPTGSFPGCTNGFGLFDMSGNVWEAVEANETYPFRGGAFNCGDSVSNHRCDFAPYWNISAKGFRCCKDPS